MLGGLMHIDRTRQREMLSLLVGCYPLYSIAILSEDNKENDLAQLWYLREHGLIEGALDLSITGAYIFQGVRITAKGLDFLEDDGGLSALLGVVNVKLHVDTIRDLLLSKVENSSLPTPEKTWLKKQVESMSGEALKLITKSLVEEGLQRMPDLMLWAKSIFQTAS